MNNDLDILTEIYIDINNNINKIDNNDATYKELINNLNNIKALIKDLLIEKCVHEWTTDTIDTGPESSQNICYCIKCEVTKK